MCPRSLVGRFSLSFKPAVCDRKLVSPDVCVVGSLGHRECDVGVCALCPTGIRSVYDSEVYCGVITVGMVQEIAPEVCARKLVSPEVGVSRSGCHRELCWAIWDTSCIVCIRGSQDTCVSCITQPKCM